jgi:hypothetical protein
MIVIIIGVSRGRHGRKGGGGTPEYECKKNVGGGLAKLSAMKTLFIFFCLSVFKTLFFFAFQFLKVICNTFWAIILGCRLSVK